MAPEVSMEAASSSKPAGTVPAWHTVKVPYTAYQKLHAIHARLLGDRVLLESVGGGRIAMPFWSMGLGSVLSLAIDELHARLPGERAAAPAPRAKRARAKPRKVARKTSRRR
jgi:hypothetical protein